MEARDSTLLAEHLNESLRRLPGPAYYKVLQWTHRALQPPNYVEIGVHKGISLLQANKETPTVVGIDPEPDIEPRIESEIPPATEIYELTSDEFFERHDLRELLGGPVALAFIDGLHLFEQVLRDFINLERYADDATIILLHDCLPLDEATASRERTTDFYCGDVWKAALVLRRLRPELEMVAVPTAPTGLCLVRGLDAGDRRLDEALPEVEETYRDLGFDYYLEHQDEMPGQIPNEREAVAGWVKSGPGS
jgi:hypothetical protein